MDATSTRQSVRSRRTVATLPDYASAQAAVDYMADNKFPVEHVTISAEGLRLVEHVTGRYGWMQAAVNGLISGAIVGALFGFVFGLFNLISPLVAALNLALYGLIFGGIIGLVIGFVMYLATGGSRSFSSQAAVQGDRYEILVDEEFADEAAQLLRGRQARVGA